MVYLTIAFIVISFLNLANHVILELNLEENLIKKLLMISLYLEVDSFYFENQVIYLINRTLNLQINLYILLR